MKQILLGHQQDTGEEIWLPIRAFDTHVHLSGAAGETKATVILDMLCQLLGDQNNPACHIIFDFTGGLTSKLIMWFSSEFCPQSVRDRLLLIQPWREEVALPINPLLFDTADQGIIRVKLATESILSAWDSQNLDTMGRLVTTVFNALWNTSQLGLAVSDTVHLLTPGSRFHKPLLNALPERLRSEWSALMANRSADAQMILEWSLNRLRPFWKSPVLRNIFGSTVNRFDVLRFMRERKIVVLDLAANNYLTPQMTNAIAGLAFNEVLATARSLARNVRYPTFCWLDEIQRLTPHAQYGIFEMSQRGIKFVLSHRSINQLQEENDLSSILRAAQTRLIFTEPDATGRGRNSSSTGSEINQSLIEGLETEANRTHSTFEQNAETWEQAARRLRPGSCLLKIVNDPNKYPLQIKAMKYSDGSLPPDPFVAKSPHAIQQYEALIEKNLGQDFFVSPKRIERERQERLERMLRT